MSLIVETGAGLLSADSFASVEEADAYHGLRADGMDWVNLPLSRKEEYLRDATDYVALKLSSQSPYNQSQGQPWPWEDGNPVAERRLIARVTIMLADIRRLGPLLGGTASPGAVLSESKGLGPLTTSRTYADRGRSPSANGRDLSFVDAMLSPIAGGGSGIVIGRSARG